MISVAISPLSFKMYSLYLFFGCAESYLLCLGFVQLGRVGATLCSAWAFHSRGFSCCGARALGEEALVVAAYGLSNCGSWAWLLHGVWDLPGPGIESVFSALADGFLTTGSPGKSSMWDLSTWTRNRTVAPEMEA